MGEALRSQARKLPDAPRDKPAQPGIQLHLPQPPSTAHRPRAETFLKQTWVYFGWLVAATCLPFTQFVSSIDTPYWSPHLLFLRVCLTPSYPGQPLMSASGVTSAGKLTPRPSRRSSGRSGVSQHSAQKREGVAGSQSFSFHQTVNSWKILMTFISGPPSASRTYDTIFDGLCPPSYLFFPQWKHTETGSPHLSASPHSPPFLSYPGAH